MILKRQKNSYKEKIIFVTDNLFNLRDYKRYGISYLKKSFDIKIYTFNKLHLKNYGIIYLKNISEFKKKIIKDNPNFLVDLMFPSLRSYLVKKISQNLNTKIIKLNLGTYPVYKNNLKKKLINLFNKKKQVGGNLFIKLFNHIMIRLNSSIPYDYYFIDSKLNYPKNKNSKIIKNHSLDYDIYLKNRKKIKKKHIVFLDSNVIGHSDYNIHSTKSPVNKNKYLNDINNFLYKIEKSFKQNVIIAANPKSKLGLVKKNFNNRKVFMNKSFELIRDAKLVLTHKSTAVSFVLCLKKPLIFVTSDSLDKTWYGDQIKYQAKLTGSLIININANNQNNLKDFFKINKNKYKYYINRYIKYPNTKQVYNWDLFTKKLSQ